MSESEDSPNLAQGRQIPCPARALNRCLTSVEVQSAAVEVQSAAVCTDGGNYVASAQVAGVAELVSTELWQRRYGIFVSNALKSW
ncbi:hypothetical protein OMCYN_01734 [cyanobiont of Ornithocercus magnificus]|nr:hypothetical protein OMCYN_01734 [cyanobiont of Ornithocercus magnificus]